MLPKRFFPSEAPFQINPVLCARPLISIHFAAYTGNSGIMQALIGYGSHSGSEFTAIIKIEAYA